MAEKGLSEQRVNEKDAPNFVGDAQAPSKAVSSKKQSLSDIFTIVSNVSIAPTSELTLRRSPLVSH